MQNIYKQILERFLIKNDTRLDKLCKSPFNCGDKTCATNLYCIVAVPALEGFEDKSSKVESIYPFKENMNAKIQVAEIKEKLSLFPLVDCFDTEESECDACYGEGEVEYEFSHNLKNYEIIGECPVCEGKGIIEKQSKIPNGKKTFESGNYFRIGKSIFKPDRIKELLFVADSLNADFVTVTKQEGERNATCFRIKDVDLVAMPRTEDNFFQSIEI